MSVISNRHTLVALTKTSKAFEGQRLARVIAKADKQGNYSDNLKESLCVSLPVVTDSTITEAVQSLLPHIRGMIADAQDAIIRDARILSGITEVADEDISIAKVVEYLDAESTGSRLTKEYLEKWFIDTYSTQAAEFIALMNKWDIETLSEAQLEKVTQKVNVLSGMFSGWSSGKYAPDIPKCKAMIKFGEFVSEVADDRMIALTQKARDHLVKRQEELSEDALGFGD